MPDFLSKPCTAFQGTSRVVQGQLIDVALSIKAAMDANPPASFLTFDDATGTVVDLDLRGTTAEVVARLAQRAKAADRPSRPPAQTEANDEKPGRGPGRPKLGVVAREVTLLPRHWDWLALQPGGASQALRRLVDQHGAGMAAEARPARRRGPPTPSCRRWPATLRVSKRRRARCSQATTSASPSTPTHGRRTSAPMRKLS
jgi:uncharacterized protein